MRSYTRFRRGGETLPAGLTAGLGGRGPGQVAAGQREDLIEGRGAGVHRPGGTERHVPAGRCAGALVIWPGPYWSPARRRYVRTARIRLLSVSVCSRPSLPNTLVTWASTVRGLR